MDKILTYLEFYICIFFLLVLSLKNKRINDKNKNVFFNIFFWIFILIFSFRTTGDDYQPYVIIFNELEPISIKQLIGVSIFKYNIEIFWVLIISLIKKLGGNHRVFFFIAILIPFTAIKRVIKSKEPKDMLFLLFWYILLNFEDGTNIVRQFVANNIYFLVLYLYTKNNKKTAFSLEISNCLVHNASFIGIPALVVCKRKYTNSCFFIVLLTSIFISGLLSIVLPNLSFDYSSYGDNKLLFKLFYYLFSYQKIRAARDVALITKIIDNSRIIIRLVFQFIIIFYSLNCVQIKKDKFTNIILNSVCLGFIINIFAIILGVNTIGTRLNNFLSIGQFYLIFCLIKWQRDYIKQKYFFILFLIFAIISCMLTLLHNMYLGNPNSIFYLNVGGLT